VLLVGGGPQDAQLRQLAKDLNIADKVVFTGRVPHDQVQKYYDLLDVLVYPRLSMRLTDLVTPLKPLEAMAQGRILAASSVGGHRELIVDGKTGILFAPDDPAALAAKVGDLLDAQPTWPALRRAGRDYVENERNWPVSVARYKNIYGRLTGLKAA
jgi:glycosyltransferase involved in cell wall biosynthesis